MNELSRIEFVRAYAKRSGLSDKWAALGIVQCGGGWVTVAMPCACGEECCRGWAMVSAEMMDHHLRFAAPQKLREAYIEASPLELI